MLNLNSTHHPHRDHVLDEHTSLKKILLDIDRVGAPWVCAVLACFALHLPSLARGVARARARRSPRKRESSPLPVCPPRPRQMTVDDPAFAPRLEDLYRVSRWGTGGREYGGVLCVLWRHGRGPSHALRG